MWHFIGQQIRLKAWICEQNIEIATGVLHWRGTSENFTAFLAELFPFKGVIVSRERLVFTSEEGIVDDGILKLETELVIIFKKVTILTPLAEKGV